MGGTIEDEMTIAAMDIFSSLSLQGKGWIEKWYTHRGKPYTALL